MKGVVVQLLFIGAVGLGGFMLWKTYNHFRFTQITESPRPKAPENNFASKFKYLVTPLPIEKSNPASLSHVGPLPKLDDSDKDLQQKASDLFGKVDFKEVIVFENFIRHFVVAIVNATSKQIPVSSSPIKSAPGELSVKGSGSDFILSGKNYKRYRQYMELVQAADFKKIVSYYRSMYPLFQMAFNDLGIQGYFNDKLVEAIANLLATPEVKEPIYLKRQSVRYEFVNPNLESLSAIQKIMIRMGPENSKILKLKFKEVSQMLTHLNS